jgi:hypothetical protein
MNDASPPAAPPRRWLRDAFAALQPRLLGATGAGAALLVVALAPLFVTFSSTQIKNIFDQFTGGCVLVLDKAAAPGGKVYVSGHIAGTMPKALPLFFEGREAIINSISFESPYRGDQIREPDDLTYHPLAGQDCPGDLCPLGGATLDRRVAEIMIGDVRPEFTYRFLVRLTPAPARPAQAPAAGLAATPDNLRVYAQYRAGFEGDVCRVEPRRWFNFWVWATPLKKAALFIAAIVAGGLLLRWAKSQQRSES